jgi:hypothetical protein
MASITTYATLVQAVIDNVEDDSTEFAAFIPTALDLAEERLFRELELQDLETKATGALTINDSTLAKPTGYKYANYFKITSGSSDIILDKKREDYVIDYWPNPVLADVPKYYADASSTLFRLAPTPNLAYTYVIKYTKQPTKLSTTNTTNYFVEQCKDALFYATMLEMATFMKAWSQVAVWQALYDGVRDTWNINSLRMKRDDGMQLKNPNQPNDLKTAVKG